MASKTNGSTSCKMQVQARQNKRTNERSQRITARAFEKNRKRFEERYITDLTSTPDPRRSSRSEMSVTLRPGCKTPARGCRGYWMRSTDGAASAACWRFEILPYFAKIATRYACYVWSFRIRSRQGWWQSNLCCKHRKWRCDNAGGI